TAWDFGTGAIYRRVPARGPVSKDQEWFTMTIVANGKHLATWVNGIQQADYVDNRPVTNNARNGCKLEKGVISLQGHDKTTDLNFRNI
ncbi:3-keto-disaccharide hydrolase, partial [Vibrio parahaemolyticus]